MRRTVLKYLIVLSAFACGGDPTCVALPCPFPVAIQVSLRTGTSQAVSGAFVRISGMGDAGCSDGPTAFCTVPGYAGTYQLDGGAPGFQTVHRTVEVTGKTDVGCGKCPFVDTQHLDIVLVPTA